MYRLQFDAYPASWMDAGNRRFATQAEAEAAARDAWLSSGYTYRVTDGGERTLFVIGPGSHRHGAPAGANTHRFA